MGRRVANQHKYRYVHNQPATDATKHEYLISFRFAYRALMDRALTKSIGNVQFFSQENPYCLLAKNAQVAGLLCRYGNCVDVFTAIRVRPRHFRPSERAAV